MFNFQPSSKLDLKKFIETKYFKKILVIAGSKSFAQSGLKEFFLSLKEKNIKFFFKKKPFPEFKELLEIVKEIEIYLPDLIIAAGGGSVLDYAKIANVIELNSNIKREIISSACKLKKKNRKLIAIPTTAGSGAEVTANAVIYINNIKYSIESNLIKPDYFFLIPDFILGASNKVKASAGFDAVAQAIESLISRKSNKESVNYATQSLNLSLQHFINFLSKPNYENTCGMAFAANLSGKAISISKTTAPHALSYPFTSTFNISHGHAVSLTLNQFMKFNYKNLHHADCDFNLKERFQILFNKTKTKNIDEFDAYFNTLKKNANLECDFSKLGIDIKKFIPKLIEETSEQRLKNNPIKISKDIIRFLVLDS